MAEFGWDTENPQAKELKSRGDLLSIFRQLESNFPKNPHRELVKRTVAMLERMVQEDEAHRWVSKEEIATWPLDAQVREWIFRLRDQTGRKFTEHGHCDVFEFSSANAGDTPAHHLVKIGFPAVPQLIEAMGGERFSRAVGDHRSFVFSHQVLSVGDCAGQILREISTDVFSPHYLLGGDEARRVQMAEDRAAALHWWRAVQENGEAQVLTEAIAKARNGSKAQVDPLQMRNLPGVRSIGVRPPSLPDLEKRLKEIESARQALTEPKRTAPVSSPE